MSVRTPQEIHAAVERAFSAGDLDALVALYEKNATFVPRPGSPVTGHAAIREAFKVSLAVRPSIRVETVAVFESDGVALLHGRWTLKGVGPDGLAIETMGRNSEVVRRQPDGSWLFTIDNPFTPE